MMRGLLVAVAAGAAAFPATASADNTPVGPATLSVGYTTPIACPAYSGGPGVIVAWEADVADGGQGGTVRPKFNGVLGDPVELPAQAGRYRFPAPHLARDMNTCGDTVDLVQTTGDHAILLRDAPTYQYVNVVRDGQADQHIDGARLAIREIVERDADRDLRGDTTEDRTDLRISAAAAREPDGRARVEITVTNAGPLAADLPVLETSGLAGARWEGDCSGVWLYPRCVTPRLAAGETRTFLLRADAPDGLAGEVTVSPEGIDLVGTDNRAAVTLAAAPAFDVVATPTQRLAQGVKLRLRGIRAGRARVTVTFKGSGKTIKVARIVKLAPYTARDVTIRPAGAKLRSLRRALGGGALSAEITARTYSGKTPVTAKATVTR